MSKKEFDQLRIDMYVTGTADKDGNGGYATMLYSVISGTPYKKNIGGYAIDTTVTRMTLKAIVEGLRNIKNRSIIHIHTNIPNVSAGLNKNMFIWEKKEWRRKDGGFLKHADLWQEVFQLLQEKTISYKVHYEKPYPNQENQLYTIHKSSEYVMKAKKELYEVAIS
ncbi:RNase H family protein [Oceanobacillus profundus]|uniref:RNase H type-1 domain-containing protein n=1 Tax=Oceanobacillus profundus TaxID=372463 RepID=A0A417YGR6_9BACI|nr:RNase H family protein [Oceanobacillus profundus]MBR2246117.1 hypothetical protein [Bacilli bacterium]MBR3119788.1 hypothetical protein [Oceanobacillus sp.]RHW31936.1 hypothetical protein D1B32_11905 [Oceanobacillus profundus]